MTVLEEDSGTQAAPTSRPDHHRLLELQEIIAVILLSVTAILTAWSGFESSKWGGAMSASFSQASSARIEASRHEGDAAARQSTHVALFTAWIQATGEGNQQVATFISTRFPAPLSTAFADWIATNPLTNPSAPASPFDMPSYQLPDRALSAEADARADAKYAQALRNNARGDHYTVLTVLFASVLFFGALATRMRSVGTRWVMLGIAGALFLIGAAFLAVLPKLI